VSAAALLMTTAPAAEAERLAAMLVERRLAACVQALPVASTYRWQGVVERADEVLLLVKTAPDRADAAADAITAAHSYEVPEILRFDGSGGLPAYLAWVAAETL
jgi:periplasmic divalent cation tolerance protein